MSKNFDEKPYVRSIYVPCWLAQIPEFELSSNAKVVYAKIIEKKYENFIQNDDFKDFYKVLKIKNEEFEEGLEELVKVKLLKKYYKNRKMIYYKFLHHFWMDKPINPHYNYETFHYVKYE